MASQRRVLSIAGSDSGGGAGIQADLKTFAALGCYGLSAITAVTAQNTRAVAAIHAVPPQVVASQLDAVLSDIGADAVKLGMLHSLETVVVVAGALQRWRPGPVVLDPVMVAKSGDRLLADDAARGLREHLLPLAAVITPNLPEAEVLLERRIEDREAMEWAARDLLASGAGAVLLKGGHLVEDAQSADVLARRVPGGAVAVRWFALPRLGTRNTHGTGCTLSSAIAAQLAHGLDLEAAVEKARAYLQAAIAAGAALRLGGGSGPVHHFHAFW
jgi:hydroxymethylpyrimidine/phosphomethylpyrimidine kinase